VCLAYYKISGDIASKTMI